MFILSRKLAKDAGIPHGEWVRRCICWGTFNADYIRDNRCNDEFKVPPRGRPEEAY